jgi:hypothetical protein
MYLITEHENPKKVGNVHFTDTKRSWPDKNKAGDIQVFKNGDYQVVGTQVCLGFHDFDSEENYNNPDVVQEVVEKKFAEIDDSFLEEAGKNPEDY